MIAGHGSSISECLNIIIYGYELLVMLDLQPEIKNKYPINSPFLHANNDTSSITNRCVHERHKLYDNEGPERKMVVNGKTIYHIFQRKWFNCIWDLARYT